MSQKKTVEKSGSKLSKLESDVVSEVKKTALQAGKSQALVSDVYHRVHVKHDGLTIGQYHDVLRMLHQDGYIELRPSQTSGHMLRMYGADYCPVINGAICLHVVDMNKLGADQNEQREQWETPLAEPAS